MSHDEDGVVDLGYQPRINSLRDIKLNPKTGKLVSVDKICPFCWDLLSKKIKAAIDNGSFVLLDIIVSTSTFKKTKLNCEKKIFDKGMMISNHSSPTRKRPTNIDWLMYSPLPPFMDLDTQGIWEWSTVRNHCSSLRVLIHLIWEEG